MQYAGLTNDPERRKQEHGNPADFTVVRQFTSQIEARDWEVAMLASGYAGDTGGAGWRYGYTFTK
ncbi:MAG: hypothetical protein ACYSYT_06625 [Planctomycetota bacterium]|jgi:hypothetical protein